MVNWSILGTNLGPSVGAAGTTAGEMELIHRSDPVPSVDTPVYFSRGRIMSVMVPHSVIGSPRPSAWLIEVHAGGHMPNL
jgi:hypothetical protein